MTDKLTGEIIACRTNAGGLPIYEAEMGSITLDAPTTVIIAGVPREKIVQLEPRLVELYVRTDRVNASRPYAFMPAPVEDEVAA